MVFVFVQSLSHVWFLWPCGLQHARLSWPSLSPGVCSNSGSLSWWCHPTISSSAALFSCPQSFPASGSFPTSWLFVAGGQRVGASATALPMNIQGWFPFGLTALISLLFKGLKRFLQHHNLKALILWHSAFFMVQLSYHSFRECFKSVPYWPCYLTLTSSKNMASPCDHRGKDQIHKFKIMLTETTQYVTNMLLLLE